jgi:hypothetical protein
MYISGRANWLEINNGNLFIVRYKLGIDIAIRPQIQLEPFNEIFKKKFYSLGPILLITDIV